MIFSRQSSSEGFRLRICWLFIVRYAKILNFVHQFLYRYQTAKMDSCNFCKPTAITWAKCLEIAAWRNIFRRAPCCLKKCFLSIECWNLTSRFFEPICIPKLQNIGVIPILRLDSTSVCLRIRVHLPWPDLACSQPMFPWLGHEGNWNFMQKPSRVTIHRPMVLSLQHPTT